METESEKKEPPKKTAEGAGQRRKVGLFKGWFLTAFLVFLLVVLGVVLYLIKYRPMEFFYVLF